MQTMDTQKILDAISGLSDKVEKNENEIMEAIGSLAENVQDVSNRVDGIDGRLDQVDARLGRLESEVVGIKGEITGIRSHMVTKSYLDDKLGDLKGDMVKFVRAEDAKILAKMK